MEVIISNVFGKANHRPIQAVDALVPDIAMGSTQRIIVEVRLGSFPYTG
jgi:hypothetical protein